MNIKNGEQLINFKLKEINEFFFNQFINIKNEEIYYYNNKIILYYEVFINNFINIIRNLD